MHHTLPLPLPIHFCLCSSWVSWPCTARPWHKAFFSPARYKTRAFHTKAGFRWTTCSGEVLITSFLYTLCWPKSYLPCYCFPRTIPKCLELLPDISDIAFDLAVFLLLQAWHESNIPVLFYIWNELYFKALMSSGQLYIISSEIYLLNRCETDLLFHYSV